MNHRPENKVRQQQKKILPSKYTYCRTQFQQGNIFREKNYITEHFCYRSVYLRRLQFYPGQWTKGPQERQLENIFETRKFFMDGGEGGADLQVQNCAIKVRGIIGKSTGAFDLTARSASNAENSCFAWFRYSFLKGVVCELCTYVQYTYITHCAK